MKNNSAIKDKQLYNDISTLIEKSKASVAQTVNSALTLLYWKIGHRINSDILNDKRAVYGQQIVVSLSQQLTQYHGNSFSEKNLRRLMQFAEVFPKEKIVATLSRKLSWSHFTILITIKNEIERAFCPNENCLERSCKRLSKVLKN